MTKRKQDDLNTKLAEIVEDKIFLPHPSQRKAKSAFWVKFSSNPIADASNITQELIVRFTGEERVRKWWKVSGFKEWFCNEDEFVERVDYLANLALDTMEEILSNPDSNPSARINAAKLTMEIANKMPQKFQKQIYLDEQIQKMDASQLEAFIKKASPELLTAAKEESSEKANKEEDSDSSTEEQLPH